MRLRITHFAPDALHHAVTAYRREFRPSAQLDRPYVIAGVNVIGADTSAEALEQFLDTQRSMVTSLFGQGRTFSPAEADVILATPAGQRVERILTYSAVGTPAEVSTYIEAFARHADADELIVVHQSPTTEAGLRSVELLADSVQRADRGVRDAGI
jgi:alkanesulfonate monooxygenase SsuD/methylene tetrahydromethanopterin reductase-like flavin-dependent oxidoreductase (luciferase family)